MIIDLGVTSHYDTVIPLDVSTMYLASLSGSDKPFLIPSVTHHLCVVQSTFSHPLVINPFEVINKYIYPYTLLLSSVTCACKSQFQKTLSFWCGRNSPISVKSQLLMHSASRRKTTDTFLSNMEHIATHHIRKAFITARNDLLLDGEQ